MERELRDIPTVLARLEERITRIESSISNVTHVAINLNEQCNRFFVLAAIGLGVLHFYLK